MVWNNTYHYNKRALSRYEKSSLPANTGRALIMPGEPGSDGIALEVSELLAVGFDLSRIVGVENQTHIANDLHSGYYDSMMIIWDEVEDFFKFSKTSYCYVHVDYCGFLKHNNLVGIQNWIGHIDPVARLRVTLAKPRKLEEQRATEDMWFNTFVLPLAKAAAATDPHRDRWLDYISYLSGTNTATILVLMIVMNFVFGITIYDWTDKDPRRLPPRAGTHEVVGINRFDYYDDYHASMESVWVDLAPAASNLNPVDHLWDIYRSLSSPPAVFSPATYE